MCKKGIDLGVDSEGSVGAAVLAPSPPGLFERVLATGQYSSVPEHVHGICEALGSLHDHRRKEGNRDSVLLASFQHPLAYLEPFL